MENLAANLLFSGFFFFFFSMACEVHASSQQEHIGVKMLIFLMHGEHRIFNELGKKKAKEMHQKLLR